MVLKSLYLHGMMIFFFFFTNPGFVGTEIFMTKVEDSLRKRTQNYENKITTFALDGAI